MQHAQPLWASLVQEIKLFLSFLVVCSEKIKVAWFENSKIRLDFFFTLEECTPTWSNWRRLRAKKTIALIPCVPATQIRICAGLLVVNALAGKGAQKAAAEVGSLEEFQPFYISIAPEAGFGHKKLLQA